MASDEIERLERALRAAHESGDTDAATRLAQALRATRQTGGVVARETRDTDPSRDALGLQQQLMRPDEDAGGLRPEIKEKLGNLIMEFNTGVYSLLGPQAQDFLAERGLSLPSDQEPEGAAGAAARTVGQFATPGVGAAGGLAARAARFPQHFANIANKPGVLPALDRTGQQAVETAARNPGAFLGGEAGGAAAVGGGMEALEDTNLSPGMQQTAGLGLGLAGALTGAGAGQSIQRGQQALRASMGAPGAATPDPTAPGLPGQRAIESVRDRAAQTFVPFTDAGAMPRARRRLQGLAADPQQAAASANAGPAGVPVGRRTGDPNLMALEQTVEREVPAMAQRNRQDLERASSILQQELRDTFGQPRSHTEWRRSVMERVAAPGTEIQPGATEDMLDQAFRSFKPLYDAARGQRVRAQFVNDDGRQMTLRTALIDSTKDPSITAPDATRKGIAGLLNHEYSAIRRKIDAGQLESDDVLALRTRIRDEIRKRRKTGERDDRIEADLLSRAEDRVTQMLESNLSGDALDTLRAADGQYRQYKIVEDAVAHAGERELTPQNMFEAIRRAASSPGRFARGEGADLRALAQSGRQAEELLGNPREAARAVRGLDDEAKRGIQADAVNSLWQRSLTGRFGEETGEPVISGSRLLSQIQRNRESLKALGIDNTHLKRLERTARDLRTIERTPPQALPNLLEDKPAFLMRLAAAWMGAQSGQRVAGGGFGSSLVLAGRVSAEAVRSLTKLTGDRAGALIIKAHMPGNEDLYRALLVGTDDPVSKQREAARTINAWVAATFPDEREAVNE